MMSSVYQWTINFGLFHTNYHIVSEDLEVLEHRSTNHVEKCSLDILPNISIWISWNNAELEQYESE